MSPVARLPMLTSDELDVLGRALVAAYSAATLAYGSSFASDHERARWQHERAVLMTLASYVAEAEASVS